MDFYKLPASLQDDIAKYEELVNQYKNNNILKAQLKSFRVPSGIYEQRKDESYMIRIRLAGGAVTPEQLVSLADIAEKYTKYDLHFTTRQDVQIHAVQLEDTVKILKELEKIGLSSRGGGGNTVRNIIGSFDSGIDKEEVFNVSPYIQALTTRMIAEPDSWTLPRKFKIAFSGSSKDRGLATINDLGFIAKLNEKGEKGFSVYIAGGMGSKPKVGFCLFNFIEDAEVYNIAKAVKNMFDKHGNRKNKHKARLRFLLEKLGKEDFITLFDKEYKNVKTKNYPALEIKSLNVKPLPEIKRNGFIIPLVLGDISISTLRKLGKILKEYGEDIIRVTPEQNIFIRNIDKKEKESIITELKKEGIFKEEPEVFSNAVACAGANTCRLGICLSRSLLTAVNNSFKNIDIDYSKLADVSFKISGCPNTCGQHMAAKIGFFGAAKRNKGRLIPYYNFVINGIVLEGKTKLAEKIGLIPAKNIPLFILDLFKYISINRTNNEEFHLFIERVGLDSIKDIFNKFTFIKEFEEDEDFYHDWHDDKIFSLAGKTTGECSAGLFDLIDLDLKSAEDNLGEFASTNDKQLIEKIITSTCRALLITKGYEPKESKEAILLFKEHFIGNHIEESAGIIIDKYLDNKNIEYEDLKKLLRLIKDLYFSMDDSLRFPDIEKESEEKTKVNQIRDFRGVTCPMNFVKTKLVLETMKTGEHLEILLDDGEPIENVPLSLKSEGHTVLETKKEQDYWHVLVKKGD